MHRRTYYSVAKFLLQISAHGQAVPAVGLGLGLVQPLKMYASMSVQTRTTLDVLSKYKIRCVYLSTCLGLQTPRKQGRLTKKLNLIDNVGEVKQTFVNEEFRNLMYPEVCEEINEHHINSRNGPTTKPRSVELEGHVLKSQEIRKSQDIIRKSQELHKPPVIRKPAEKMVVSFDREFTKNIKKKPRNMKSVRLIDDTSHTHKPNENVKYKKVAHEYLSKDRSKVSNSTNSTKKRIQPSYGNDLLYGISPCLLALKVNRRQIIKAYVRDGLTDSNERPEVESILTELRGKGTEIVPLHRSILDNMTKHRPHQGICLEVSRLYYTTFGENIMSELSEQENPIWLVLDQILDPMNLGAILRSCYFLGAHGVIVGKKNSCNLSPVVSKASSGVMEIQPVHAVDDLATFLQSLSGWDIIGTSSSSELYQQDDENDDVEASDAIDLNKPTVLVIGNEGYGLKDNVFHCCNQFLSVYPGRKLYPGIDSLNVSVATGILLHTILFKRQIQTEEKQD